MKDKINLNNYRLTGLEEPSDELLAALMKEVAEEAVRDRIEQAKADVYEQ